MRKLAIFTAAAFLALVGPVACGDDDDDDAPQLSASHPGWMQADCATCHTLSGIHGGQREWTECFGCHGGNGQPNRPAGHSDSGCTGCHSVSGTATWDATSHADYGAFTATQCLGCHD